MFFIEKSSNVLSQFKFENVKFLKGRKLSRTYYPRLSESLNALYWPVKIRLIYNTRGKCVCHAFVTRSGRAQRYIKSSRSAKNRPKTFAGILCAGLVLLSFRKLGPSIENVDRIAFVEIRHVVGRTQPGYHGRDLNFTLTSFWKRNRQKDYGVDDSKCGAHINSCLTCLRRSGLRLPESKDNACELWTLSSKIQISTAKRCILEGNASE